jgi:hypothetical protein
MASEVSCSCFMGGQICGSGTPSIDCVREFDYDIDAPASQSVAADATAANEQARWLGVNSVS